MGKKQEENFPRGKEGIKKRPAKAAGRGKYVGLGKNQPLQTGTIQPLVSGILPHWIPVMVS